MSRKSPLPGEFDLIERYLAPLARGEKGAFGLKDDAAFVAPRAGNGFVITADAIVEGVHFLRTDPPEEIAQKALRVNLSDLAAKGARPRTYFMTTAWSGWIDERWIASFAEGLARDQKQFGVTLGGGDTVRTMGPLSISITALGEIRQGMMVRRNGAAPGDDVWVTGTIGDAGLGLRLAIAPAGLVAAADRKYLLQRYRVPEPRVSFGLGLARLASAAVDVSDGLVADAGHVARQSGLALTLALDEIPTSAAAQRALAAGLAHMQDLVVAGDDYEILFTAPSANRRRIEALAAKCGIRLSRIGSCQKGPAEVFVLHEDGEPLQFAQTGFTHF
jgi:thiamine-monophosphate kinase